MRVPEGARVTKVYAETAHASAMLGKITLGCLDLMLKDTMEIVQIVWTHTETRTRAMNARPISLEKNAGDVKTLI